MGGGRCRKRCDYLFHAEVIMGTEMRYRYIYYDAWNDLLITEKK